MADEAHQYLASFAWARDVAALSLAYGVGGVVALFLAEFRGKIGGTDDRLWVVVGDLPSAYLVVEPNDTPSGALERYCRLMDDWAFAVLRSTDLDEVFPVASKATAENANALRLRMAFLRTEIIPDIASSVSRPKGSQNEE
jgi:hypothetical protein